MATGNQADFLGRLQAVLPQGWFPAPGENLAPVLTALLNGPAWSEAWIYSLLGYTTNQTRIATATDVWLDIIAQDFFGLGLLRYPGQTDASYLARIQRALFAPKNTRAAMLQVLQDLTGNTPEIFEPANTGDTGGYGSGDAKVWTGLAYNDAGGYGSLQLPFQAFITIARPLDNGIANVMGYYEGSGWAGGGYGVGALEYANPSIISDTIPDSEIYATIAATAPVATIMWTKII